MATQSVKMDSIQVSKKVDISTSVTEIDDRVVAQHTADLKNDTIIYKMPVLETQFDCVYPAPQKRETFNCEYPTVDPNVKRVSRPLPFPEKLQDLIGWTDAFVDRIASMTAAQEKKTHREMTMLAREIERLRTVLATTEVDLAKSREDVEAANAKTKKAHEDAAKAAVEAAAEAASSAETIKKLKADMAREASEERTLRQQLRELKHDVAEGQKSCAVLLEKNIKLTKEKKELAEKLGIAISDDEADDKAIHDLQDQLNAEHNLWEAERDAKQVAQKELGNLKIELQTTKDTAKNALEVKDKKIATLEKEIAGLHTKLDAAHELKNKLQKSLNEARVEIKKRQDSLEDAQKSIDKLSKDLTSAQATICERDVELKGTKANVDSLTKTKAKLEGDLRQAREEAKTARADEKQAQKDEGKAQEQLDEVREELAQLKATNPTEEVQKLKDCLIPNPHGKSINILSVEYGGRAYTYEKDRAIYEKLYQFAEKGDEFKITNALFGGKDPWQGECKSCSITYQLGGKGAPIHIVGREWPSKLKLGHEDGKMMKFKMTRD